MKVCICSTAGVANQLVHQLNPKSCKFIVKKEAKKIFIKNNFKTSSISIREILQKAKIFYLSTGDKFSKDCIKKLKKNNKYVVAIFDHWINFKDRIDENYLPDEAWVFDNKAKNILNKIFPHLKIILKKNLYLINEKKKYENLTKSKKDILYITEPLEKNNEIVALNYFIKLLYKSKISYRYLLIKVHPKEIKKKYIQFFLKKKIKVKIYKDIDLINLFAKSKFVVGRNSMALYLAQYLNLNTFYCIPKYLGVYKIPSKNIKNFKSNIRNLEKKLYV